MVLRVSLVPDARRSFRPGEALCGSVEVANESHRHSPDAFDICITKFFVEVVSTERVDHTWISLAYGADIPPTDKDNRRETREVFRSQPCILDADAVLRPGESRIWHIRMQLPDWLPPSFRGVSVRYGHVLKATISFTGTPAAMQHLTKHLSLEGGKRASSGSLLRLETEKKSRLGRGVRREDAARKGLDKVATAQVPLLVLPQQKFQPVFSERAASAAIPGLITGDDAELLPIAYTHMSPSAVAIRAREAGLQSRAEPLQNTALLKSPVRLSVPGSKRHSQVAEPGSTPHVPQSQGKADSNHFQWNDQTNRSEEAPSGSLSHSDRTDLGNQAVESERLAGIPATPMTAGIEAPLMKSYNLRLADDMLARLTLHPPTDGPLCLGATLSGTVDLRGSQEAAAQDPSLPICVQMMVLLETEERVHGRWSAAIHHSTSAGVRHVQDEHQELTPNTLMTHFMLSIPQDAPASFSTSLISLRWILRFEFLTVRSPASVGWLGGGGKVSEQLSWALPVLVKPLRF